MVRTQRQWQGLGGKDAAAVAAIQLSERCVLIEPSTLQAVGEINPDAQGLAELSKLWAWIVAHNAVCMLNPQNQLMTTYEHMEVAPSIVQQLIGNTVWKAPYGEAAVQTNTIVPEQLKKIIAHQLDLMREKINGDDTVEARRKAEKRAKTQYEELTRHTRELEKKARRTAAKPY